MSDLKKDNEIKEIFQVETNDLSCEAQNSDVAVQTVNQEIGDASASEQFENVVDSNIAVVTNCNDAPDMLQTEEIVQEGMTGSLMLHEPVQSPSNELPRNNETNEDIAPAAVSQPSRKSRKCTTGGITIKDVTAEETVPRRFLRIKDQNDRNQRYPGLQGIYSFLRKRAFYMDNKRDEYAWHLPDGNEEEIGEASATEQSENVVDSNIAVITNCNNAPEMLQSEEIVQEVMTGSLMPYEPVQAPINELPRNSETNEDIAPAAPSQPSRKSHRCSTRGITIKDVASEETVPKRSVRIKDENDKNQSYPGLQGIYSSLGKRPLYMDNKKDEYVWFLPDGDEEDEE